MTTESVAASEPGAPLAGKPGTEGRAATPLRAWIAVGLVILAAAAIRFRLLDVPLERDEGEYAYQGALTLSGIPPYAHVYTQKLPGAHLLYALSMAVFGQTVSGARAILVVATAAACLGVFLLGRRFFSTWGAVAGSVAYAVLSLSTELLGPFGHATHFVAVFEVWGLVVLAEAMERDGNLRFLFAGVLLGLAVLMKQHGVVFVACAAVWILIRFPGRKGQALAAVLAGAAAPLASLVFWFFLAGNFGDFWFWVVRYASAYGTMQSPAQGWENLTYTASRFLPQAWLLWLLAAAGAGLLLTRRLERETRLCLGALVIFSFLGVCPGLYFRDHYFLLFLPAGALLVGATTDAVGAMPRSGGVFAAAALALSCGQALWAQREVLFEASPDQVSRLMYGRDIFPESVEIGRYLRTHTNPGDTIVVFGSEPQIPFYAHRRSATGFVFMYPLMQTHGDTRRLQELMVREVESARPAYAVVVKVPTSWLGQPESDPYMPNWAARFLDESYEVVGHVLATRRGSRYLWDEAALGYPIGDATQALVVRRRDRAAVR